MAYTLVVNPGSSSKKYALYREGVALATMRFERTELGFEQCTEQNGTRQKCEGVSADTFTVALDHFVSFLTREGLIASVEEITIAVVRIVVPGTRFQHHAFITDTYIHKLREHESAAPLHMPHMLKEVVAVQRLLPRATLIAASDSAFHATMSAAHRRYSVPADDAATYDLYRFGYHGLSVASVVRRYHAIMGHDPKRVVVCHIGSGVSVTAVDAGRSVYTSMGYAPGTGVVMGTRAGDIDAGALLALMRQKNLRPLDAQNYLQTRGGLLAVAGDADLRLVLERAARSEPDAMVALDMFIYHIAREVAAGVVALGGIDALVFTATASERSAAVRKKIIDALAPFQLSLSDDRNEQFASRDGVISNEASAAKVAVIRTDEMGEMYWVGHMLTAQSARAGQ